MLTIIVSLYLLFVAPQDGGDHPRKDEMVHHIRGFHPEKDGQ